MAQPKGSIARPDLTGTKYQNRLNFWSSFNAKPKPKHKFIVRFGNNAFFGTDSSDPLLAGKIDIDLNLGGFTGLDAISNLAWVVKSCGRPSWNTSMKEPMYEQDGEFVGFKIPTLENIIWQPIEVKLVNVTNYSFYPSEMPTDLDLLLSALIDASGYRFDKTSRTAGISDVGLPPLPNNIKTNKNGHTLRSRQLFEPFEIIDLSGDVVNGGNTEDFLGHTVEKDNLPKQGHFPIGKWTLYEPYLLDVNFGQNSYENENQFIEYTMKIGYYWAAYTSFATSNPVNTVNSSTPSKFSSSLILK